MPRTVTDVDVAAVIAGAADPRPADDVEAAILREGAALIAVGGVDHLEVDEVARRAGCSRSTVYRHFDGRNALLSAIVADQARRVLGHLAEVASRERTLEDQVVAAFVAGADGARRAGLPEMLRRDALLLRIVTVEGGPVLAAARDRLTALLGDLDGTTSPDVVAEVLVRLAISFVVTPESALDLADESAVRAVVGPLLAQNGGCFVSSSGGA